MSDKTETNEKNPQAPATTQEQPTKIKDGTYEIVLSDKPVNKPAIDLTNDPPVQQKADEGGKKDDKQESVEKPDEGKQDQVAAEDDGNAEPKDGDKKESADDASATAKDQEAKPKVPKGVQNRINRLTREKRELERQLQEKEQALQQSKQSQSKGDSSEQAQDDKGPKAEDFESWDDYVSARDEWQQSRQTRQSSANEPAQVNVQQSDDVAAMPNEVKEAVASIHDTFDDSREKHDDFDKVLTPVAQSGELVISDEMTIAISESEAPGELVYHLAKNPKESQRIAELPKTQQIKELLKLEASMQTPPKPTDKQISNAPDPITPLEGNSALPRKLSDAKSQEEYAEIRKEMDAGTKRGEGWL